jgi:protein-L-isoaspartate(D-aspartate) O-methyltransferase
MAHDPLESRPYRQALVATLRYDGHLHSARVEAALLAVPREVFLPGVPLEEVYRPSEAIVTKRVDGVSVSSASAPEVIALMLEQLDAQPGDHVLEIGAGTGYNAALLAHLVGETGRVVSLDLDEDLVLTAREHLAAVGYSQVSVIQTDGALGYPAERPYDRIILTVASGDIAPAWREQLARPGGRLVLPLALPGLQRCVVFLPDPGDDAALVSRSLRACSFIPLRGLLGSAAPRAPLDKEGQWLFGATDDAPPFASQAIAEVLGQPLRAWSSGVSLSFEELRIGLHLWLVAHEPKIHTLWGASRVPDLFGLGERLGARGTLCLIDAPPPSMALLAWADEEAAGGELCIVAPRAAVALVDRLRTLVTDWVAAGRPTDADLRIRAYPAAAALQPLPGEVVLDQRWTRLLLSWARLV